MGGIQATLLAEYRPHRNAVPYPPPAPAFQGGEHSPRLSRTPSVPHQPDETNRTRDELSRRWIHTIRRNRYDGDTGQILLFRQRLTRPDG